jgi:hypothetical protein
MFECREEHKWSKAASGLMMSSIYVYEQELSPATQGQSFTANVGYYSKNHCCIMWKISVPTSYLSMTFS